MYVYEGRSPRGRHLGFDLKNLAPKSEHKPRLCEHEKDVKSYHFRVTCWIALKPHKFANRLLDWFQKLHLELTNLNSLIEKCFRNTMPTEMQREFEWHSHTMMPVSTVLVYKNSRKHSLTFPKKPFLGKSTQWRDQNLQEVRTAPRP